jgi:hypothetical protein
MFQGGLDFGFSQATPLLAVGLVGQFIHLGCQTVTLDVYTHQFLLECLHLFVANRGKKGELRYYLLGSLAGFGNHSFALYITHNAGEYIGDLL